MISEHFEKYFQKLKIDKIPLEELQYFVFEIKKSKLNTTLQLPNMPAKKNKKNIFCWLVYCLEIIDDNDGLDFLSKDLQDFFENVVANTDNQFFEDVIDYCLTLEKKRKKTPLYLNLKENLLICTILRGFIIFQIIKNQDTGMQKVLLLEN